MRALAITLWLSFGVVMVFGAWLHDHAGRYRLGRSLTLLGASGFVLGVGPVVDAFSS